MQIALLLLVVLLVQLAHVLGKYYGWYYHALILGALAVALVALFRFAFPTRPPLVSKLPPTDDPEGLRIRAMLESVQVDLVQIDRDLKRDMVLLPILACAPPLLILCLLQQRAYLPPNSIWFKVSMVPFLLYVVIRFILSRPGKHRS
jgi:hypothetical protein